MTVGWLSRGCGWVPRVWVPILFHGSPLGKAPGQGTPPPMLGPACCSDQLFLLRSCGVLALSTVFCCCCCCFSRICTYSCKPLKVSLHPQSYSTAQSADGVRSSWERSCPLLWKKAGQLASPLAQLVGTGWWSQQAARGMGRRWSMPSPRCSGLKLWGKGLGIFPWELIF